MTGRITLYICFAFLFVAGWKGFNENRVKEAQNKSWAEVQAKRAAEQINK